MSSIYSWQEIVSHAIEKSPFYREYYKNAGAPIRLSDLPVLDQAAFWKANHLEQNHVLTEKVHDGIMFKSGGTTGNPKFSYFTRDEWETFTLAFGHGIARGGLAPNSRVANLFYAGELYASFLFIMKSLENSGVPVFQLPLTGSTPLDKMIECIEEFKADTIAGVPTTIMNLVNLARENRSPWIKSGKIKILFGGESLYTDQRRYLHEHFPNITVQSIGCASVDAGLLGWVDSQCKPDEHYVFANETVMEIVDDHTGHPISEIGVPGRLVLTALTRKWMPIIRYPVGDLGVWLEKPSDKPPKFKLLGRAEEGARVGPTTLYYDDIYSVLVGTPIAGLEVLGLQLLVTHYAMKDELTLRIAVPNPAQALPYEDRVLAELLKQRPMLADTMYEDKIHSPRVSFVELSALEKNNRTGKVKRIVDQRALKFF